MEENPRDANGVNATKLLICCLASWAFYLCSNGALPDFRSVLASPVALAGLRAEPNKGGGPAAIAEVASETARRRVHSRHVFTPPFFFLNHPLSGSPKASSTRAW